MLDRINPGLAPQSFLMKYPDLAGSFDRPTTIDLADVATDKAIEEVVSNASLDTATGLSSVPVTPLDKATTTLKAHTGTTELVGEVAAPAEPAAEPTAEPAAEPTKTIKDALTGAGKAPEDKTTVEHFCDEHWHQVAVALITTMIVFMFAIVVLVMLGIIKVRADVQTEPALSGGNEIF